MLDRLMNLGFAFWLIISFPAIMALVFELFDAGGKAWILIGKRAYHILKTINLPADEANRLWKLRKGE
jgi:hypothetical protein